MKNKTSQVAKRGRGRPKSPLKNEVVQVWMPSAMVDALRKNPDGVSAEVRERVARSLFEDEADPGQRVLAARIEQLAKGVKRAFGKEWHTDLKAQQAFVHTIHCLLRDLPSPPNVSDFPGDPITAGETIYRAYCENVRESERLLAGAAEGETRELLRLYGPGGEAERMHALRAELRRKEKIRKTINKGRS